MGSENIQPSLPKSNSTRPSINMSLVLLSLATVGTMAFIIVSSSFPFEQEQFETAFPKAQTQASSNIVFIDAKGNEITQTASPTVVVRLESPWQQTTASRISVSLSEDGVRFGEVFPYTNQSMTAPYTFQNKTPCNAGVQCKTIYAKFVSNQGFEQVYFRAIELR